MTSPNYRIPQLQPLPLSTVFSKRLDMAAIYPFADNNYQYYYLARNAIWHGVDALGLKPGDVVLMPAYHHGIEVETLLRKGLQLVYYRIDENMHIDFEHLESLVTPETSALYIIHYIGFPQAVKRLSAFAASHNLKFIEDCALSLFSSAYDVPLGASGDISIFCLYKTLPVPHGGMLVVNKAEITLPFAPQKPNWASTTAILANRILDGLDTKWGGVGYQLNNALKSVARKFKRTMPVEHIPIDTEELVVKHLDLGVSSITRYLIRRLGRDFIVMRRRRNYSYLAKLLKDTVDIPFEELPEGVCPLFLPVLVEHKKATHDALIKKGVEAVNFWSRNHHDVPVGMFPEVTYLREHILELPIHQGLEEVHMEYVASKVKQVL